jgi:hypothetical protein
MFLRCNGAVVLSTHSSIVVLDAFTLSRRSSYIRELMTKVIEFELEIPIFCRVDPTIDQPQSTAPNLINYKAEYLRFCHISIMHSRTK